MTIIVVALVTPNVILHATLFVDGLVQLGVMGVIQLVQEAAVDVMDVPDVVGLTAMLVVQDVMDAQVVQIFVLEVVDYHAQTCVLDAQQNAADVQVDVTSNVLLHVQQIVLITVMDAQITVLLVVLDVMDVHLHVHQIVQDAVVAEVVVL